MHVIVSLSGILYLLNSLRISDLNALISDFGSEALGLQLEGGGHNGPDYTGTKAEAVVPPDCVHLRLTF